ncbi:MAG: B12-binding domain-containing radical SAM protein [Mesorhizobium sp.]|nr:MAG: B12-binding domain-containing radical SAM protein [Mesorhizobium sp.]
MNDPRILGADGRLDLLLVNSPLKDYGHARRVNDFTLPTLGLGYIATVAAATGFSVGLLDSEALGLGLSETVGIINDAQPGWAGFNLLAPTYAHSRAILAGLDPGISVMLGGHQAKAMPREILEDHCIPRIDALVVGEAETRVPLLLADIESRSSLPSIGWRNGDGLTMPQMRGDKALLAPNIDAMPFLDRKYLVQDPYLDAGELESAMVASRGCPFDCSFCGAAVSANPDVSIRMRSPDNLIAEMATLRDRYGVTRIRFVDDLFLANSKIIVRTLDAFVRANLSLRWDATGRINVLDKVPDDTIDLMVASGCREVALGIEAGSDRLLKHIDKKISVAQTIRVVTRLCSAGISVKGYFILGLPTETREEHRATLDLIETLWSVTDALPGRFRCSAFEYRPYPGTPDWLRLLRAGYSPSAMLAYSSPESPGIQAVAGRDEFNFSTGIQFGEVPVDQVRKNLYTIMALQNAR